MQIKDTVLSGVTILELEAFKDSRGEFSRIFCHEKMCSILNGREIKQINRSITHRVGAIRGWHFQYSPYAEMKIVRCLKGRVFDVAVDLRSNSPTFLRWIAVELSNQNNTAILIPEGCAHGFQVLEEDSELLYLHTSLYTPSAEGAVRFDDPMVGVNWPITPTEVSQKDLSHPYLDKAFNGVIT